MTLATWLSIGALIGSSVAVVVRWRAARAEVETAKSAARASEAVLYQQLQADYHTPEMREALEAIKEGNAELAEYRLVSHFFRAATDLVAAHAIKGEMADNIKELQGKYLMKDDVIPWEQEHRAQINTFVVESQELNRDFLREFNLT